MASNFILNILKSEMLQTSDNLFSLIKAIIHLHSKILINNFNKSRNDEIKK